MLDIDPDVSFMVSIVSEENDCFLGARDGWWQVWVACGELRCLVLGFVRPREDKVPTYRYPQ